jgi:allantoinase
VGAGAGAAGYFDLVVRGRVVGSGAPPIHAAVAISGGRIAAVGDREAGFEADEELDFGDCLVLPGVVDAHVHSGSAPGEGLEHATRAAAAGGVTTVADMPFDVGGTIASPEGLVRKAAVAEREALVDVALWAAVLPSGPVPAAELSAAGARGLALSTITVDPPRYPGVGEAQMQAAFAAAAAAGLPVAVHAEDEDLVFGGIAAERAAGRVDGLAHARSRPPESELLAVARCLRSARLTGVALHLTEITLEQSVTLAREARRGGADVTVETCPHYLLTDEDWLAEHGAAAKCNPPLRPRSDVEGLWRALAAGELCVASDHVAWPRERKSGGDVLAAAGGGPGVELMLPLMHDAVRARGLGVELLARVLAEAPARRLGLWPRKGGLRRGADADVVVLDPDAAWTVDHRRLHTPVDWSPYDGWEVRGRVVHVLARGETVCADGVVTAAPGRGQQL